MGYGGVSKVHRACGLSRRAIALRLKKLLECMVLPIDNLSSKRERGPCHARAGFLEIGEIIESVCDELVKQIWTKSIAVKHNGNPSLTYQGTDLLENGGQHFDHTSAGLSSENEEWASDHIVNPMIRCRRHRQTPAYDVRRITEHYPAIQCV
jgi:hypothetical protein